MVGPRHFVGLTWVVSNVWGSDPHIYTMKQLGTVGVEVALEEG